MKVRELIKLLQEKANPDSQVEIYAHPAYGACPEVLTGTDSEYAMFEIVGISDWGNPGSADDLTCINLGKLTGC